MTNRQWLEKQSDMIAALVIAKFSELYPEYYYGYNITILGIAKWLEHEHNPLHDKFLEEQAIYYREMFSK